MKFTIRQKKIILFSIAVLLVVWSIFLFSTDIESLIASVGIGNVYLILFIIAVTTSTSFLTSTAFYVVFLSYINAGFDPLVLGIIGGIGMSVGDCIYFYFSRKAGDLMHADNHKWHKKIYDVVSRLPRMSVYIFTYLYVAFTPIPNDILMIALGVLRFRVRYVIPIIILGNITLLGLIAYGINITLF